MKALIRILLALLPLFFAAPAFAGSAAGSPIQIGVAIDTSTIYGSGSAIVNCAETLAYAVELNSGGTKMTYSANTLNYALYRDAGRTLPWRTQAGGNAFPGTGNGLNQELVFYGRVPAYQNVPIGPYSDTLSVTVIW